MSAFDDVFSNAFNDVGNSYDPITVADLIESKDRAIASYANVWQNFIGGEETDINVDQHIRFLRMISDVNIIARDYSSDMVIMAENDVCDAIETYIRDNFYDMLDYADNDYDWPHNCVEFDMSQAIQQKIDDDGVEIQVGGTLYYSIPDIFEYL
jgi:hypothetical protein